MTVIPVSSISRSMVRPEAGNPSAKAADAVEVGEVGEVERARFPPRTGRPPGRHRKPLTPRAARRCQWPLAGCGP